MSSLCSCTDLKNNNYMIYPLHFAVFLFFMELDRCGHMEWFKKYWKFVILCSAEQTRWELHEVSKSWQIFQFGLDYAFNKTKSSSLIRFPRRARGRESAVPLCHSYIAEVSKRAKHLIDNSTVTHLHCPDKEPVSLWAVCKVSMTTRKTVNHKDTGYMAGWWSLTYNPADGKSFAQMKF